VTTQALGGRPPQLTKSNGVNVTTLNGSGGVHATSEARRRLPLKLLVVVALPNPTSHMETISSF
jgi:orotidine-5'-phosphate decarboxylase